MSQLASDDFNRANGGLGANWTTTTSEQAPTITSNEVVDAGALVAGARYTGIAWPADQYAEVVVGSVVSTTSDEGVGPAARIASAAQTHYLGQSNTVETRLYKCVSGGFTQLGSDAAAGATGNTIRLTANGSSISLVKNSVTVVGPVTDSSVASGDAGIWCTNLGAGTIDSFAGGDLLVASAAAPFVVPWLKSAGGLPLMGMMAPGAVPDSAATVVSVTGTLATTNADDTLAAAGTTTVTGTLARTNGNDTSAASGTTTVTGTLARTNANDTSATTGTTTLVGTLATTNANDSLSAAGVVGSATGTVAVTNANDTVSASGVVTPPSDSQPSGGFFDYGTARERRRLAEKAHRRIEEGMGADAPLPLPQDEPDQQRIRRKTITRADLLRAPTLPGLDVSLDVAFIAARQRRQRDEEELLLFS